MNIEDLTKQIIKGLRDYTDVPFYLAYQNIDTGKINEWGTIQILNTDYVMEDLKHRTKRYRVTYQINVNCKNVSPYKADELANMIINYLSRPYYYNEHIDTVAHYPVFVGTIRDISSSYNQVVTYSKSLDVTFEGYVEYIFDRVPIEEIEGTVTEIVTNTTTEIEEVK